MRRTVLPKSSQKNHTTDHDCVQDRFDASGHRDEAINVFRNSVRTTAQALMDDRLSNTGLK
jgi:hypothetical protein